MDFEKCGDSHLSPFIGSYSGATLVTLDWAKQFDAFCPNDPSLFKIKGSDDAIVQMKPEISVRKCYGAAHCKSPEEIDAFAATTWFQVFYKSRVYNPDKYFDETFTSKSSNEFIPLIPGITKEA